MVTRVLLIALLALPSLAQAGPCTAPFIKGQAAKAQPDSVADDLYFFSGALDKPVVGTRAAEKASAPVAARRKDEKHDPLHPDRVVVSASGDMAYEYGTAHMSYTERDTGKLIDFTAAYLRVWKGEGGSCKLAAEMFEPEGEK